MRACDCRIQVTLNSRHTPVAFKWLDRIYCIKEVHECWRLLGMWWDGEGEQTFFRVQTDKGGIYELCFDHAREKWGMSVVQD